MKYEPIELSRLALRLEVAAKQSLANADVHWLANEEKEAKREETRAKNATHFAEVCRYFEKLLTTKSKGVSEGKDPDMLPTTPQSKRIATLFNRKLTTAWSEREVAAYKKLGTIPEEDLAAIERYYASERAKGDEGVHRRDLGTFLNNFAGELDRAKAAKISKNGKITADTEPEGWREWCASKGYPVGEFRYAKDWMKSEFRRAGK